MVERRVHPRTRTTTAVGGGEWLGAALAPTGHDRRSWGLVRTGSSPHDVCGRAVGGRRSRCGRCRPVGGSVVELVRECIGSTHGTPIDWTERAVSRPAPRRWSPQPMRGLGIEICRGGCGGPRARCRACLRYHACLGPSLGPIGRSAAHPGESRLSRRCCRHKTPRDPPVHPLSHNRQRTRLQRAPPRIFPPTTDHAQATHTQTRGRTLEGTQSRAPPNRAAGLAAGSIVLVGIVGSWGM